MERIQKINQRNPKGLKIKIVILQINKIHKVK